MTLSEIRALGFDFSRRVSPTGQASIDGPVRVACSRCHPAMIQGVPCHERGCPNEKHECKGCSAIVARNVRYCEECQ